jgi:murein DD-endopeptidase MepM/ murein hydrolase activator NlpD
MTTINNKKRLRPPWFDRSRHIRQRTLSILIHALALVGLAALYYAGFSLFFDTPLEYGLKHSNRELEREYRRLTERLDTLDRVLDNVAARDRNIFRTLFEAEPYDFDGGYETDKWATYENLLGMSNKQLGNLFVESGVSGFEKRLTAFAAVDGKLKEMITSYGDYLNYIPAIQPVINRDLTLLTASYGMRIQPFYKHLTSHQGVDYTLPVGSRVFATADGVVEEAVERSTSFGRCIVINHSNGYKTEYHHLQRIDVANGQRVRRGDIIALSGNTGLSFAPHLHYEVQYKGMRVDPVHYFFMELSPEQYERIMRIAHSGMQSFD